MAIMKVDAAGHDSTFIIAMGRFDENHSQLRKAKIYSSINEAFVNHLLSRKQEIHGLVQRNTQQA